ncbi:BSD domain-containing protein 1 [Quillaja saponaria]|uniref:BSD domain-containing protein 1 n=1 Tax=Quillaja saponaria TaxID=32244 RepID=A0AAD7LBV6_QUISA|nr:BSD domain-containing protein 1 [Quillaja saponaria]
MDFFKSVFSDDPQPSDPHEPQQDDQYEDDANLNADDEYDPNLNADQNSNRSANSGGAWSFGGLIKTLATKSESVIDTYRRDLEEFSSGLKKETAVIREVASRAVKDLPVSLEVGASVAQESLESVGQAIDDIGSSVWKSTAEIISHGRDTLLTADLDSDSSDNNISIARLSSSRSGDLKRYSRFDAQVRALQCDANTYLDEPEDLENYNEWKSGFELDLKEEEIDSLIKENDVIDEIYVKVVPNRIDRESFWSRYFYKLHKLKQAEDARAKLVKRAISGDEEEDLSWDFDDDEEDNVGSTGEIAAIGETDSKTEKDDRNAAGESESDKGDKSEGKYEEKMVSDAYETPSMPEEEDLGWDEIEDIGSNDDSKGDGVGITSRVDLRKRMSVVEQDEDLSWDIEDDDEPIKS